MIWAEVGLTENRCFLPVYWYDVTFIAKYIIGKCLNEYKILNHCNVFVAFDDFSCPRKLYLSSLILHKGTAHTGLWYLDLSMKEGVCLDCCCPHNSSMPKSFMNSLSARSAWHLKCACEYISAFNVIDNKAVFGSCLLFPAGISPGRPIYQQRMTCIWLHREVWTWCHRSVLVGVVVED